MKRVFDHDDFVFSTFEEDTTSENSKSSSSDSMFDLSEERKASHTFSSFATPPKPNVSRPYGTKHLYFGEGSSDEWSEDRDQDFLCGVGPKNVAKYDERQRRLLAEQELAKFSEIRLASSEAWFHNRRKERQARSAATIDQRLRFAMRYGISDVEDETPEEWYERRDRDRANRYGYVPLAATIDERRRFWGLHNMFNVDGVNLETLDNWHARIGDNHVRDPNFSSVCDLEGDKDTPARAVNTESVPVFKAKRNVNSSLGQVVEKKAVSTDVKWMRVVSCTQEDKSAILASVFSNPKSYQGPRVNMAFMDELAEAMWQNSNDEDDDWPHAFKPEHVGLYEDPSAYFIPENYLAKIASLHEGVDLMRDAAEDPEQVASTSAETSDCWIDPDMDLTEKYKEYDARLEAHYELVHFRRESPRRWLDDGEMVEGLEFADVDWHVVCGVDPTDEESEASDEELLVGQGIWSGNVAGVQGAEGGKEGKDFVDRDEKLGED